MRKSLKRIIVLVLICFMSGSLLIALRSRAAAVTYSGYIMGYFKDGVCQYGLNLCYSTDGRHWTDLNGGLPVLYPKQGTKGLRDPFIYRQQDGTFVVVATDMKGQQWGDHSQYIHCWDSKDLCTFRNERLLKMHTTSMHTWAPEIFYDNNLKKYGIIWSGNTDYNRTYVNYTTDFKSVSESQVFFDPGYDVIDSDVQQYKGINYLFFKDERADCKAIKAAKSKTAIPGSFSIFTSNFITSPNTEGPITFKDNKTNKWYMFADLFTEDGVFELWSTTDLDLSSWTKVKDFSLPPGTRHASVVPVTREELNKIKSTFTLKY